MCIDYTKEILKELYRYVRCRKRGRIINFPASANSARAESNNCSLLFLTFTARTFDIKVYEPLIHNQQKIEDTLLPAKKEIERSLGTNGVVEEHDKYR